MIVVSQRPSKPPINPSPIPAPPRPVPPTSASDIALMDLLDHLKKTDDVTERRRLSQEIQKVIFRVQYAREAKLKLISGQAL